MPGRVQDRVDIYKVSVNAEEDLIRKGAWQDSSPEFSMDQRKLQGAFFDPIQGLLHYRKEAQTKAGLLLIVPICSLDQVLWNAVAEAPASHAFG